MPKRKVESTTEKDQSSAGVFVSQAHTKADEIALEETRKSENQRIAKERASKETMKVVGYEARFYFNKPKAQHLAKLLVVQRNEKGGNIFRKLVGRKVPISEALRLSAIRDIDELEKIHKERGNKFNYGFSLNGKVK